MELKIMRIYFPQPKMEVRARLHERLAPKTCAWVWDLLTEPVENEVWHVKFLGRALTCRHSLPQPEVPLQPENLTITPAAGDLLLVNFTEETGRSRGTNFTEEGEEPEKFTGPNTYAGFDLFYGPDSRMLIPMGWHAACHFASITDNLAGLARVAHLTRLEGIKKVIFSRAAT